MAALTFRVYRVFRVPRLRFRQGCRKWIGLVYDPRRCAEVFQSFGCLLLLEVGQGLPGKVQVIHATAPTRETRQTWKLTRTQTSARPAAHPSAPSPPWPARTLPAT